MMPANLNKVLNKMLREGIVSGWIVRDDTIEVFVRTDVSAHMIEILKSAIYSYGRISRRVEIFPCM